MKKRAFRIVILIAMTILCITGCDIFSEDSKDSYSSPEGKGLFAIIDTDNANILTTETDLCHYYYLKDTGIVYVGHIFMLGMGSSDFATPVITENGNYCRYNVEKKQVEEIIR